MGVNLHISTRDGRDAPIGWSWLRCTGDRDIAGALGKEIVAEHQWDHVQEEHFYRPDPASLREFCKRLTVNESRWEQLAWIFENKPDLWLRVSW